jgi:coniferyl-aldehyde dehydrogenase
MQRRYPTLADNPDYTAIVDARQAGRLRDWLEDARRRGTAVRQYAPTGETIPAGLELIPPTVLLDPPDDAMVMKEEVFGPLLSLKSYDRYEDALAFVLDRDKPLAFYTFDNDGARVEATLDRVCAGMVCVNDSLIQFAQTGFPVGGVGPSGMGHYHGHAGFLTFSKAMPVLYQSRWNAMKMLDPPYTGWGKRLIAWLTR